LRELGRRRHHDYFVAQSAQWNGVKYKACLAAREVLRSLRRSNRIWAAGAEGCDTCGDRRGDFITPTWRDCEVCRSGFDAKSGFKFGIDSMYGAGRELIAGIFTRIGVDFVQIRGMWTRCFRGSTGAYPAAYSGARRRVVANKCDADCARMAMRTHWRDG